jgi:hypothetical protein
VLDRAPDRQPIDLVVVDHQEPDPFGHGLPSSGGGANSATDQ